MNYYMDQEQPKKDQDIQETKAKIPKITGLIMGDPVISFSYQYNNFGSFALARGLIDYNRMQKMSAYESSFILQTPTNKNICNMHKSLQNLLRDVCPYNVELKNCMPEEPETKGEPNIKECSIFPLTKLDSLQSLPFKNYLRSVHNVLNPKEQETATIEFFRNKIPYYDTFSSDPSLKYNAASMLSSILEKKRLLVY